MVVTTPFAQIIHETPSIQTREKNPADCLLTHTYCLRCFIQVRDTMRAVEVMDTLAGYLAGVR